MVTATASDGTDNTAVYNDLSSSPIMTRIIATASGGINNIGVYNEIASSPTLNQVVATATGGSASWNGLWRAVATSRSEIAQGIVPASRNSFAYGRFCPAMKSVRCSRAGYLPVITAARLGEQTVQSA